MHGLIFNSDNGTFVAYTLSAQELAELAQLAADYNQTEDDDE